MMIYEYGHSKSPFWLSGETYQLQERRRRDLLVLASTMPIKQQDVSRNVYQRAVS